MKLLKPLLSVAILATLAWTVVISHGSMNAMSKNYPDEFRSYFLPSADHMKVLSMGHRNFWADTLYIWSILYFDYYNRTVRYKYLDRTFSVITDLDPKFQEAYILGALFAFLGGRYDLVYGIENKGIELNPRDFIIPYDAGCYALFSEKNYERAAVYFNIAQERNPSRTWLKDLLANTLRLGGDLESSLGYWKEIFERYKKEEGAEAQYYLGASVRHIWELHIMIDQRDIATALGAYRAKHGVNPRSLSALRNEGFLDMVPKDPTGEDYYYDPSDGKLACRSKLDLKTAIGQWK